MKIAISTDAEMVSPHFGRCPQFTIVEIGEDKKASKKVVENPGHHPGYLPQFLSDKGVTCIIAGGMGARARELFREAGIDSVLGVQGKVDTVIEKIISGTLEGAQSMCSPGEGRGYGLDKTVCDHEEG